MTNTRTVESRAVFGLSRIRKNVLIFLTLNLSCQKKMVLRLRSGYNEKDVWMKYAVHECVVKRFSLNLNRTTGVVRGGIVK